MRNLFNLGKEEGRGEWKRPSQQKANIIPPYHFSCLGRRSDPSGEQESILTEYLEGKVDCLGIGLLEFTKMPWTNARSQALQPWLQPAHRSTLPRY